jgi:glycosyltransferase involved in cell wall biosynthesis
LNVLITNRELVRGGGTEIVTRDLAFELKRLGHAPAIYSPALGPLSDEIRDQGIPVFGNARSIEPVPDVIHGHSHPQTLAALLRFPVTPAIFVCHDATAWAGEPLIFPRVLRYVAVDERCRQRIEKNQRIARENIRVILNAVDLSRFKPRPPLPEKPRRAAIFSNYATKWTHTVPITRACESLGLELDVIGKGANTSTSRPEVVLPKYDLVFAKARCALEAMATGSAVVLCDFAGLGVMVSSDKFAELRQLNFGAGTLVRPLDPELIAAEIRKYDANDARLVAERTRKEASLSSAMGDWIDLYEEVAGDWRQRERSRETPAAEEMTAVAEYLLRRDKPA